MIRTAAMRSIFGFVLIGMGNSVLAQTGSTLNPPNIIMVSIDDLGDYTGYLEGHPQTFTPVLDRLAATGVAFTSAHCTTPVCAPSRLAFLTGKSSEYTGVYTNSHYTSGMASTKRFRSMFEAPGDTLLIHTIPEWLKDAGGYYTIGMGKVLHGWSKSGFDRDYDEDNPDPCSRSLSWSDFRDFNPDDDPVPTGANPPEYYGVEGLSAGPVPDMDENQMMDTKQVSEAISFIQDYSSNPGAYCNRPFFLAVGLYRPHEPFYAPQRYFLEHWQPDLYQVPYVQPFNNPPTNYPPNGLVLEPLPGSRYSDFENLPLEGKRVATGFGHNKTFNAYYNELTTIPTLFPEMSVRQKIGVVGDAMRANVSMSYLAAVRYADAQLGRLIDALEADPALAANTIVVVFSDHGFDLGQKQHWLKNALWDKVTRVPFIIRDPRIPGGKLIDQSVSLLDVFPTICELADVPAPLDTAGQPYFEGRSLAGMVKGEVPTMLVPSLTSLQLPDHLWFSCYPYYAVHTGRYHGIRYRVPTTTAIPCDGITYEDSWELYDLGPDRNQDPHEWVNLANLPPYADMIAWMDSWMPGGALHRRQVPEIAVGYGSLSCVPSISDTLVLFNNTVLPESAGLVLRWNVPVKSVTEVADTLHFPLSVLPSAMWSDTSTLHVFLELVDSNGVVLNMEAAQISLGLGVGKAPFTISKGDKGRSAWLNPLDDRRATWDFGDGITWQGVRPSPHQYTYPGEYLISRVITEPSGCVAMDTQRIELDGFDFFGTCLTPYPPQLDDAGPDAIAFSHTPVWAASGYGLRVRDKEHGNDSWSYLGLKTATERLVRLGRSERTVEVQVKTFCFGGFASPWSVSSTLSSTSCRPPFDLSTNPGTDSVHLEWVPLEDAVGGQLLTLLSDDSIPRLTSLPEGANTCGFESLLPDHVYTVIATSLCRDIGGDLDFESLQYTQADFQTLPSLDTIAPDSTASRMADSKDALRIWPNPSHDGGFFVLPIENELGLQQDVHGDRAEERTLRIVDYTGRVWHESNLPDNEMLRVHAGSLPRGTYLVTWEEKQVTQQVHIP